MNSDQALDALLTKLSNVKKAKDGHKASCPLAGHKHGDKDPSLSISIGDNGEIVAYCFSQHEKCYEDVLTAVGLSKADMRVNKTDESFDQPRTPPKKEPKWVQKVTGHERIHPYREADGTKSHAIGISRRPTGKSIGIPYTMDTSDRGGALMYWAGDPYLYNLDQIATSNGKTAYIPEGEQDCDTLTTLGKLATTNPFGASSCLNVDYSPLGGKDNVVLFDNDQAGRARAQKVANTLHPISTSVKVVELPGLEEGGDVTDWVEAGGTVDEFDALVDAAPLWEPTEQEAPDLEGEDGFESARINFDGFFTLDRPEAEYLVEPIWPLGRSISIVAKHKQGKSLFAGEMAAALATGNPFLGKPASAPIRVMYLDMEMTEEDVFERLESMGYNEDDEQLLNENLIYYSLPQMPPLDTKAGGRFLYDAAKLHRVHAIIIDTASRVVDGDENSNDTWQDLYKNTLLRLKQTGISLARLDHLGKDKSAGPRGGSSKGDDVDVQ